MKLCYRGVHYDYNPTSVPVEGKRNVVNFRGCSYVVTHAVVDLKVEPAPGLVYRGVATTEAQKRRFLGQTYELQPMALVPACSLA